MHIIIGGAYQGKLDYAKKHLGVTGKDLCDLATEPLYPGKRCYLHIETFVRKCLAENSDAAALLLQLDHDCILISDDVSCGVVPMDAQDRAWREAVGRTLNALCADADHVTRIFCGLPLELK